MKPRITFLLVLLLNLPLGAQVNKYDKTYVCENGKVYFVASALINGIQATSTQAICVINEATGKITAECPMRSFVFRIGKMQDDFNESYVESDKYPNATYSALIVNKIDFSKDGVYDVVLKGTFTLHGIKRQKEIKGKLTIANGRPVSATAQFDVKLEDFNIAIPRIVAYNVTKVATVDLSFEFTKYKPNI